MHLLATKQRGIVYERSLEGKTNMPNQKTPHHHGSNRTGEVQGKLKKGTGNKIKNEEGQHAKFEK